MKKVTFLFFAFISLLILGAVVLYASAAVYFCFDCSPALRKVFAGVVLAGSILPFLFTKSRKTRLLTAGAVLLPVYAWYLLLQPKLDANWSKDVAVMPDVHVDGNLLRVRNIRNFQYRSDTDFDAQYYDKVFDLDKIRSVDLFLAYWGTTSIAHTIMSFGFDDGSYLPISIETRKEVGEVYSAVEGFFKKFELIYILADERDLIGVRVNHRNEDVYLYRLKPNPEQARKMLLDYVKTIDRLETIPVFYNALTTNCTTSILPHIRSVETLKFNWALLANGYIDRWRYEQGVWGFDLPFEEFRGRSQINEKVKQAGNSPNFSALIREGLPSIKLQPRPAGS